MSKSKTLNQLPLFDNKPAAVLYGREMTPMANMVFKKLVECTGSFKDYSDIRLQEEEAALMKLPVIQNLIKKQKAILLSDIILLKDG